MSPWGTGAGSFFSSGISVTSASVATWIGHKPGRRRLWTRTDGLIGTPSATTLAATTCFYEKALICQDRLGGQKSGTG